MLGNKLIVYDNKLIVWDNKLILWDKLIIIIINNNLLKFATFIAKKLNIDE